MAVDINVGKVSDETAWVEVNNGNVFLMLRFDSVADLEWAISAFTAARDEMEDQLTRRGDA